MIESVAASSGTRLWLSKHEAAGNDFLVLLGDHEPALSPGAVRALCDRHRGVGADGVLVGRRAHRRAGTLTMVLYNADGTEAEMSGNGIRCLVDAAVRAGWVDPGPVLVETAAGDRTVDYRPAASPGFDQAATAVVDMGPVTIGALQPSPIPGAQAVLVDVGNPHLVVVTDETPDDIDLDAAADGARRSWPAGINVEVVRVVASDTVALRVHERGVGETLACGTGSCAAAAVVHHLGLTGRRVTVRNPGGELEVTVGETRGGPATLGGPVRHVADIALAAGAFGDPTGGVPASHPSGR